MGPQKRDAQYTDSFSRSPQVTGKAAIVKLSMNVIWQNQMLTNTERRGVKIVWLVEKNLRAWRMKRA